MSYHIESNHSFGALPERILVREDGWLGALRFDGEPVVDYWYVPERTCSPSGEWERFSQTQEVRVLTCQCGEVLGRDERNLPSIVRLAKVPNFCPNCGRRVIA